MRNFLSAVILMMLAAASALVTASLAHATTCSEAVARCKANGASKPYIEQSCEAAGASCMRTGKFVGPVTNAPFKGTLERK